MSLFETSTSDLRKGDFYINNDNTRVKNLRTILRPLDIINQFTLSDAALKLVATTRTEVSRILASSNTPERDDRLLVIIGPCSIHDRKSAFEYAQLLKPLIHQYRDTLCIVMRVYFEKPRTTVGWKGLINDPHLNNSYDINTGLKKARSILVEINNLGVPTAGEFLDTMTPQYIADCMSWGAIGARTTESQLHRELASGLSCPVGFKNATNGSIQIAIDAMVSASYPHNFIGINKHGEVAIIETLGNRDTHVILRGGADGPNYTAPYVKEACSILEAKGFTPAVMIDCSHANSEKDYRRQWQVCQDISQQIGQGSYRINGVMIESHLIAGRQDLTADNINSLTYGQSITDGCVGWEQTEEMLQLLSEAVLTRRNLGLQ